MEENSKIIERKNIIISVLLVIVIALAGLCVYMFLIKPNEKQEVKDNNNLQQETIDLSKADTINSFKIIEFKPKKLTALSGEKTFDVGSMENTTLNIKVANNKVTVTYKSNKTITKEYNDVKGVYYVDYSGCSTNVYVYIFSGSKLYLVKLHNVDEEYSEADLIKEIDNSKNYDSVYEDYLHPGTCDHYSLFVGHTSDGKYYDLATGIEYIDNLYYYYDDGNHYIKNDMTYKFGELTGKTKYAFIDEGDEKLDAFIDDNDNLYVKDFEKENAYKLNSNSKVVKVEYVFENYPRYVITLADGTNTEVTYSNLYK